MQNLKRILAVTDFSAPADHALRRAALLAKQHEAELHLLHVVHPLSLYPGQDIDVPALDNAALGHAGERLGAIAKVLAEHYGIRTHTAWRIGRAHAQIAEYARETSADLVVAGARGESTMRRLLLGSTSARLLRVRSGPTLIVRNTDVQPYERVLAAVDFSADSRIALAWARCLAGKARLDVVHVLESELDRRLPQDERENRDAEMRAIAGNLMSNLLADLPGENTGHVETGYPPARLLELTETWRTNLVVLGRHGPDPLAEFLLGSVSKDVAQTTECDVLVTSSVSPEGSVSRPLK